MDIFSPYIKADIIIQNGTVLSMNPNNDIINNGIVIIKGREIQAVGGKELLGKYSARKVIDADGGIVMPGMINTHSHLPMIAFRGLAEDGVKNRLFDYFLPIEEKKLTRDLIYKATIHGAIEFAMSGVTTFVDMYYHMDEMARAATVIGVRAVLGEAIMKFPVVDAPTPYGGLEYAKSFIREYKGHPLVTPAFAPHAPYSVSTEKLQEVIRLSEKYEVPVLIHVAEGRDESEHLPGKYKGLSPVSYLHAIGFLRKHVHIAHAINVTDQDLMILEKVQCGVAHNPICNSKEGNGIARVYEMKTKNIRIGIGTDGPMTCNSMELFTTMKAVAMLQRVKYNDPTIMRPFEIVRMATIGGAESLYMDDRIGSLEQGKLADIIIIETKSPNMLPVYDPYAAIVFQAEAANVAATIIDGKIVMENRRLKTYDLEKNRQDMQNIVRDITPFARDLEKKARRKHIES